MELDKIYLKRSEVARVFGVSPHTVTRWAHKGKLPHLMTLGGHFRFPKDAINRLVTRLEQGQ